MRRRGRKGIRNRIWDDVARGERLTRDGWRTVFDVILADDVYWEDPVDPPAPPVIIEATAEPGTTTITVGVSLAAPGPLRSSYRDAEGFAWTDGPDETSSLYADHVQTIVGLMPDHAYEVRIEAYGDVWEERVLTVSTLAAPTAADYPGIVTGDQRPPPAAMTLRAGEWVTDPLGRLDVRELAPHRTSYSQFGPARFTDGTIATTWNVHGRVMPDFRFVPFPRLDSAQVWPGADRVVGSRGGILRVMDLTGVMETIDLGFESVTVGDYQGRVANDGRVGLLCRTGAMTVLMLYSLADRREVRTWTLPANPDNACISPDGRHIAVQFTQRSTGGARVGTDVFHEHAAQSDRLEDGHGHYDTGEAGGRQLYIYQDLVGDISAIDLVSGARRLILDTGDYSGHLSSRVPEWVLLSRNWKRRDGDDVIQIVRLDGSQEVAIVGHYRTVQTPAARTYETDPMAHWVDADHIAWSGIHDGKGPTRSYIGRIRRA